MTLSIPAVHLITVNTLAHAGIRITDITLIPAGHLHINESLTQCIQISLLIYFLLVCSN